MKGMLFALLLSAGFGLGGCGDDGGNSAKAAEPVLYQVSTIDALLSGIYDGSTTVGELKRHGDFGLGTFDAIDGEMVVFEGTVYQVKSDGSVNAVDNNVGVPFATVHFFTAAQSGVLSGIQSYAGLKEALDGFEACKNYPCAFRLHGRFARVKTRSAPKATKPYPPLAEHVAATQNFFYADDINGTLLGYKLPAYFEKFNVPGYHFHFISDDKTFGGHVLEVNLTGAQVSVQPLYDVDVALLRTDAFARAELNSTQEALDKVER